MKTSGQNAPQSGEQPAQSADASPDSSRRKPSKRLHLHLISDAKVDDLATVVDAIKLRFAGLRTVDHAHTGVRNRRQLRRALAQIEASPGIVIHSLAKQELAEAVDEFCERRGISSIAAPDHRDHPEAGRPWWVGAAILLILLPFAAFLVWQVTTKSLAHYFAGDSPELALKLQPKNPVATLKLAERELRENLGGRDSSGSAGMDPVVRDQVRSLAYQTLQNDPLNARALSVLGQIALLDTDESGAEPLLRAAAGRSRHESGALRWMMTKSFERQDFAAAIHHGNSLMRSHGGSQYYVVPLLAKMAEIEEVKPKIKELLESNPPWRSEFFRHMYKGIVDARTPLDFLLSLQDTKSPPDAKDVRNYIDFLISKKFYELAYYAWLQFLPKEQLAAAANLFNGDFELDFSDVPFDWAYDQSPGLIVERNMTEEIEGHALLLQFGPGRVDFTGLRQIVVLPAGDYELQGKRKARLVSKMGMRWYVTCVGKQQRLGESATINGTDPSWIEFAFSFSVPKADCPAQYIRFASEARSASEQFISGSLWFDDLNIKRMAKTPEQSLSSGPPE